MNSTLARRAVTIPVVVVGWLATLVLLPALLPLALVVDGARWLVRRTPFMAVRMVAFLAVYLTAEVVGLTALAVTWVLAGFGQNEERLMRAAFRIQVGWAAALLASVRSIFGLRLEADGLEAVVPSPFLILARHTSIVDNLLAAHFVSRPHDVHIRYVMKAELLSDPSIDVAGNRLPNVFVRRGSGASEIEAVRALAETLPSHEAILIYPEGSRYTPAKRDRGLRRLAETDPALHAVARGFRSVIPPKPGGTLALLEGCAADVVVMAHRGLDGFARVADIWRGSMVRTRIDVKFWRIPRTEIPESRSERAEWLMEVWRDLDEWVRRDPATAH